MITKKDVTFKARDLGGMEMKARLFLPEGLDETAAGEQFPAIVINHPTSSDFNQTSGKIYGTQLAERGWITLAFDSPYQGQSEGEPHNSEIPYARTIAVMSAIDYLDTLPFVDPDRIGAMGMCGGGGYTINAAKIDHRIKAVAGLTAANVGVVYRETFGPNNERIIATLEDMAKQRTKEAQGAPVKHIPVLPENEAARKAAGINDVDIEQAMDYYLTPRGQDKYAPNQFVYTSLVHDIGFDPISQIDRLLTQPLELIVGGIPGGFGAYRFSYEVYDKAASENKEITVIPGVTHYELYDKPEATKPALDKLDEFFSANL